MGIGGETVQGILRRLPRICEYKPDKIFIHLGVNELRRKSAGYALPQKYPIDSFLADYSKAIDLILKKSPDTQIYIISILPVIENSVHESEGCNAKIIEANQKLKLICKDKAIYIDCYPAFISNGQMNKNFTNDGVLISKNGYELWAKILRIYL